MGGKLRTQSKQKTDAKNPTANESGTPGSASFVVGNLRLPVETPGPIAKDIRIEISMRVARQSLAHPKCYSFYPYASIGIQLDYSSFVMRILVSYDHLFFD